MAGRAERAGDRVEAGTERAREQAKHVYERLPTVSRRVFERAVRHHTATLAAGLAFFGLISLAPAIGAGIGLAQLLLPDELVDQGIDLLQDGFTETIALGDVLEQMEGQAGQYLGIGLVTLLWPASTLAGGWRRALDAINEFEPSGIATGGIAGRLRGIGPAAVILAGLMLLLGGVLFGSAAVGDQAVLVSVAALGAAGLLVVLHVVIYRWLPSEARPLGHLWRGALIAAAGVVLATVGFALLLTVGEGFADRYPPALSTSVIVGLWLYAANLALLVGDEFNAARVEART